MTAKHAPAPWWVTEYGVRDAGGYICHTQPPTHFPDQDERFANEVEERKANARLIAAAPELMEACKAMIAWDYAEKTALPYDSDKGVAWHGRLALCAEAFDKARVAITKATGATS